MAPADDFTREQADSEDNPGEDPGDFVSEQNWGEVKPIMAAIRQMKPEIKKWVKDAVITALIQFISDYEITIDEEDE